MFFLKTCKFNGVKPRAYKNGFYEGLFCIDIPESRFSITPCNKPRCLCCHTTCPRRGLIDTEEIGIIPFSIPHIHRFVKQYEAILNCPAVSIFLVFIYCRDVHISCFNIRLVKVLIASML